MPHQEYTKCIEQGYLKSLKDGARVIVRKFWKTSIIVADKEARRRQLQQNMKFCT